jgi:hypothetical protein
VDDLSAASQRFGVRIDALIGLDVLGHSSFRIDYGARKIYFGPVASLPSSAPFVEADAKICVDLRAGGTSLHLLVDTGAERVLLLGPRVARLAARSDRTREFSNLGGNFTLREISLNDLQLGTTNLGAHPVFVSDARNVPAYPFDGFLSTAQFRQIAFDFERREFSWMTTDDRLDRAHVAANPSAAPSSVTAWAEEATNAAPAMTPHYCGEREAPGITCELR